MRLANIKSGMSGTARPAHTNGRCGAIRSTNFCRYCSSPQEPKTIRPDGTVPSGCSAAGTLPDGWIRRLCPSGGYSSIATIGLRPPPDDVVGKKDVRFGLPVTRQQHVTPSGNLATSQPCFAKSRASARRQIEFGMHPTGRRFRQKKKMAAA